MATRVSRPDAAESASPVEILRALILSGQLEPRERLVEDELIKRLGASRAAVREALKKLTHDGLVEHTKNVGASVRYISLKEAIELYECREVMEGLCARKAAKKISPDGAERLTEIGRQMEAAVEREDWMAYSQLNQRLHSLIWRLSEQGHARMLVENMDMQLVRHRFPLALRPGRPLVSLPQHLAIIRAIVGRDSEAAEAAMRAHVRDVTEVLAMAPARAAPDEPGPSVSRSQLPGPEGPGLQAE